MPQLQLTELLHPQASAWKVQWSLTPASSGEMLYYRMSLSFCCFQHPSSQPSQNHKPANKREAIQQAVKLLPLQKPSGGPWHKVQHVLCFSWWCHIYLVSFTAFFPTDELPHFISVCFSLACLFFISVWFSPCPHWGEPITLKYISVASWV